jgi:CheY-like chemotaxis protein
MKPRARKETKDVEERVNYGAEVLVVDDNKMTLAMMTDTLQRAGYTVTAASNGEAALERLEETTFDLVITDLFMPGLDGITVLRNTRSQHPATAVIVTGELDSRSVVDAFRHGASDCVLKPFDAEDLSERAAKSLMRMACERMRQDQETYVKFVNEQVSALLFLLTHDIRGALVSLGGRVRQKVRRCARGGKRDANDLDGLERTIVEITEMAEEYLALTFAISKGSWDETSVCHLERDIIDPACREFTEAVQEREIVIRKRGGLSGADPLWVEGNSVFLKAVYRNILANAVKNCPPGGEITFGARQEGPFYRLNIFNTGDPIPKAAQAELFSLPPGGRRLSVHGRVGPGLGIGLALVREIIERAGGRIWYEGTGRGSDFVFTVPAASYACGPDRNCHQNLHQVLAVGTA